MQRWTSVFKSLIAFGFYSFSFDFSWTRLCTSIWLLLISPPHPLSPENWYKEYLDWNKYPFQQLKKYLDKKKTLANFCGISDMICLPSQANTIEYMDRLQCTVMKNWPWIHSVHVHSDCKVITQWRMSRAGRRENDRITPGEAKKPVHRKTPEITLFLTACKPCWN